MPSSAQDNDYIKDHNLNLSDDPLTLAALGIGAFILADLTHEALGHGGMCLASGGEITLLTSVYFRCAPESTLIDAAGPLANLLMGGLLWLLLTSYKNLSTVIRVFLVLCMAFNLFWATGYLIYSGVTNNGDWAFVIHDWQPLWLWRTLLIVSGFVSYYFSMRILGREARTLISINEPARGDRIKRLFLIPYLAAGIAECLAALFDRHGSLLAVKEAFLESFCAFLGFPIVMLWLGRRKPTVILSSAPITRRLGWLISITLLLIAFIAAMGHGMSF